MYFVFEVKKLQKCESAQFSLTHYRTLELNNPIKTKDVFLVENHLFNKTNEERRHSSAFKPLMYGWRERNSPVLILL